MRKFGWKPDKPDQRDRLIRELKLGAPPSAASVRISETTIKDQDGAGACTGAGSTYAYRIASILRGVPCPELSMLFTYAKARLIDGEETLIDEGATIRSAVKSLVTFGACDEAKWPFDDYDRVKEAPTWKALRNAYDRRGVRGYYRIMLGMLDDVRRSIAAGHPVIAGWDVNEEFCAYSGGIFDEMAGPFVGGHCMCIESYNGSVWTLLNSWGDEWGEGGRIRVTDEFMQQGRDLWSIVV